MTQFTATFQALLSRSHNAVPRRLRPGTLDLYLLGQIAPPFFIALSVVLIALLLERLLVLFNLLAAAGSPLGTFLGLLADLLPHYLGLALPAALCVGVFTIVSRMSQNNEIDAIMASGRSLARIALPMTAAGVALAAASILLYGYIQPHARYQFRAGFYEASHDGWAPMLQSGMFATPTGTLMLTADHVDQAGSRMHNVFIRDTSHGKERDITARSGTIRIAPDSSAVQIDLTDGQMLTRTTGSPPSLTVFQHSTRLLTESAKHAAFRNRGADERELTSGELFSALMHQPRMQRGRLDPVPNPAAAPGDPPSTLSWPSMRAEFHFRLARSLSIPFISLLACALAISRKRRSGSSGIAIAALALVTYDHALQFGASLIDTGRAAPALAIWAPTVIFCAGCAILLAIRSGITLPARRNATIRAA